MEMDSTVHERLSEIDDVSTFKILEQLEAYIAG